MNSKEIPEVQVIRERYDLIEIISHILIDFKWKLDNEAGQDVDSILIWRPVKFHDENPDLDKIAEERLKKAFHLAWFKNIEFQYEPVAAYNAFLSQNPHGIERGSKTLVVDLWWWTSDFSIILN